MSPRSSRAGGPRRRPSPGSTAAPHAYLAALDGDVQELEGPIHQPLGAAPDRPSFASSERRLAPGERLILVTDGITQRRIESGMFGIDGLRKALADMQSPTAAATP